MKTMPEMNLTLYELSAYNEGRLVPHTFDLTDTSREAFEEERSQWLADLTAKTGRLCEEWIVCDSEGIPRGYVGEYDLSEEFWEWLDAYRDSGVSLEVFEAGAALGIPPHKIEECYYGAFDSPTDFAWEVYEEQGYTRGDNPLLAYVDWEWVAKDLLQGGYTREGYHYFSDAW